MPSNEGVGNLPRFSWDAAVLPLNKGAGNLCRTRLEQIESAYYVGVRAPDVPSLMLPQTAAPAALFPNAYARMRKQL